MRDASAYLYLITSTIQSYLLKRVLERIQRCYSAGTTLTVHVRHEFITQSELCITLCQTIVGCRMNWENNCYRRLVTFMHIN